MSPNNGSLHIYNGYLVALAPIRLHNGTIFRWWFNVDHLNPFLSILSMKVFVYQSSEITGADDLYANIL